MPLPNASTDRKEIGFYFFAEHSSGETMASATGEEVRNPRGRSSPRVQGLYER